MLDVRQHPNILVFGPIGGDRTLLSCSLPHSAYCYDFTVRHERTSRLVHELSLAHGLARHDGSRPSLPDTFAGAQVMVFDD